MSSENIEIITKANNYKLMLAERGRINYAKRKAEGRLKKHLIPVEEQKKRGPRAGAEPRVIKEKPEQKQRGRHAGIIDNIDNIPPYINKLIIIDNEDNK